MAGAFLLGLIDKMDARRRQKRPNLIGLVSHDNSGVAGRRYCPSRLNHVLNQRQAAGAVQYFSPLGFHPGAKASGQDHHIGLGCHLLWLG